ncbi:MAG: hypothetical protein IT162_17875 [Bryobacterales bacterium]|nr:hypothetical protein [Bryobacterales bacterium]
MPSAETNSEFYTWEIAGRPVAVKLSLSFVDRLLQEVMRGFGAMPRRGVEMGGILLGSVDRSSGRPVVIVEDYEPVPCQHSRGATYQLSGDELDRFKITLEKWSPGESKQTYAVGYYRSHTREGLSLADEDVELFNQFFPSPEEICLVVKPFATRVSQAGIFFRENGNIRAQSSYQEFPFRRRELSGATGPAVRPSVAARAAAAAAATSVPHHPSEQAARGPLPVAHETSLPQPAPPEFSARGPMAASAVPTFGMTAGADPGVAPAEREATAGSRFKSKWVWLPLSIVFLILGTVLGLQIAMSVRNSLPASLRPDPYSLHLTVTPSGGDSLHVRWNRDAAPIHDQAKGSLVINDGGAQKIVALDADQLRNGSVVYRRASNDVRFRLEVQTAERVSVAESMDFKVLTRE